MMNHAQIDWRPRNALFTLALLLAPVICSAQTTVRAVGGTVEEGRDIFVLLEIRSTEQVGSIQGSFWFNPFRLQPTSYDVGNAVASWGDNALTEIDTALVTQGRIGFRLRLLNGNALCCAGHYNHFISVLLHVLPGSLPATFGFDDSALVREVRTPSGALIATSWAGSSLNVVGVGTANTLRYENATLTSGQSRDIPMFLQTKGGESGISFTFLLDPSRLFLEGVFLGPYAAGASLITNPTGSWRVGVVLALPPGQSFPVGERHILNLRFRTQGPLTPGFTRLWFSDDPSDRELVTVTAQVLPLSSASTVSPLH